MKLIKLTEELYKLLREASTLDPVKDLQGNWVLPYNVIEQAQYSGYWERCEIIESEIDLEATQIEKQKEDINFYINRVAYSGARLKDHRAIDWISEAPLRVTKINNVASGLPELEVWKDENGNITHKVEKEYLINEDGEFPASNTVSEITETAKFKATNTEDIITTDIDGNVIQSITFTDGYPDDILFHKVMKRVLNPEEKNEIGSRRRNNILTTYGNKVGAALILLEEAADRTTANIMMTDFMTFYGTQAQSYIKSGLKLYNIVSDDTTHVWLDKVVPNIDDATAALYDISELRGLTLRDYSQQKLKGLI